VTSRFAPALVLCLLAGSVQAFAQTPTPTPMPPPPTPPTTITPTPQAKPPTLLQPSQQQPSQQQAATKDAPRKGRGRDVNVQVEITIGDQTGSAAPEKRVVSMIVADFKFGRIRSSAPPSPPMNPATLNIDAAPEVLDNDRIQLSLTIEYLPVLPEAASQRRPALLNETLTVILQSGKPMLVSQAADPVTDRKMTVEVKATVLK
jgi:hypothetical protein